MTKPRFFLVLPKHLSGPPRWNAGPLMRYGEHSRPAYQVRDREDVKEGNDPALPFHAVPAIVADGLNLFEALSKLAELNTQDLGDKAYAINL